LREITRHLRRHATPLHQRELAEIDRRTIPTLLGEIEAASGAVSRNRVRTTLSAFWSRDAVEARDGVIRVIHHDPPNHHGPAGYPLSYSFTVLFFLIQMDQKDQVDQMDRSA
jgi:hypothetical protein